MMMHDLNFLMQSELECLINIHSIDALVSITIYGCKRAEPLCGDVWLSSTRL